MIRNKVIDFIDIGANLVDPMFSGIYNGSRKHEPDLKNVLERAWKTGVKKIIITGTDLEDSKTAVNMANSDERLFCTVGCHPTNCSKIEEFGESFTYLTMLSQLCVENNKVVALGEFGLDFDRTQFCPKETQLKFFEEQLLQFEGIKKPLFLHCRNAASELIDILSRNRDKFLGGVVHSFDGSIHQARKFIDLGLFIGINGCSIKTEENMNVIKELPSNKILLETDSPWCEVRSTHAGNKYIETRFDCAKKEKWDAGKMIKGRNEPCNIIQILEIISKVRGEDMEELGRMIYENTEKLFFSKS